jgi:pyridoxal phosphate enzyme (YggS family)
VPERNESPNADPGVVETNIQAVHAEMEALRGPAWRDGLRLIAVSKTVGPAAIRAAAQAGVTDFGENRVAQLVSRQGELVDLPVRWHLIGHLQRNKAGLAVKCGALIHSVDSLRLALELDRVARAGGVHLRVLLEINVSGEASKSGFSPAELPVVLDQLGERHRQEPLAMTVEGLMTMAPLTEDTAVLRATFRGLAQLKERLQERTDGFLELAQLSMGMSNDYRIAIEEGATMVRVGRRIFGG